MSVETSNMTNAMQSSYAFFRVTSKLNLFEMGMSSEEIDNAGILPFENFSSLLEKNEIVNPSFSKDIPQDISENMQYSIDHPSSMEFQKISEDALEISKKVYALGLVDNLGLLLNTKNDTSYNKETLMNSNNSMSSVINSYSKSSIYNKNEKLNNSIFV